MLEDNKSLPVEEASYVYMYDNKIIVKLLKKKVRIEIPYSSMTDLQNVDAGNKAELDRVIGLDSISARVENKVGLLRKRHRIVTIIKYTDKESNSQVIALDFHANTKYAQPLIDKKMHQQAPKPFHSDTNQEVLSIADELSKLAKLKEQGVITEQEFLRMKNNLIEKS